jgi:hypothetical protein
MLGISKPSALAAHLRYLCDLLLNPKTSASKSLIHRKGLLQVVDFHDIFTYFSWVSWRPFAVVFQFSKVRIRLTQLVDFQDSFR